MIPITWHGRLPQGADARRRRSRVAGAAAVALGALALAFAPGAGAAACSPADQSYTGACGPEFELPAWGDAAGWTNPSHYSTIQLADVNGDGRDELIGRAANGLQIWEFDTKLGQWRPQVDARGLPQVLTNFRDPLPSEQGKPNYAQPQYYSTIQTANVDGKPGDEIVARFPDGMREFAYTPPAGTEKIDGGSWSLLPAAGPFSDADGYTSPQLYLSIHAVSAAHGQPAMLVAQTSTVGDVLYRWNGSGWEKTDAVPGLHSDAPADYLNVGFAALATGSYGPVTATVSRTPGPAISGPEFDAHGHEAPGPPPLPGQDSSALGQYPIPPYFGPSDFSSNCPAPGSTDTSDCFDISPSYYETLRFADIDGDPGDEMLGRLRNGLNAYKLDGTTWQPLAVLGDLEGSARAANPPAPGSWGSIRSGDILGNGRDQVLALDGKGLQAFSYDPTAKAWTRLAPKTPLELSGDIWSTDPSHYSTIQVGDVNGDGHADVIARGPYGIRTFFYDLHGSDGWTSYMPQDPAGSYPAFPAGQAAAFEALNSQSRDHGVITSTDDSVRDIWTDENAPQQSDLDRLQQGILSLAGCTGLRPGAPPQYRSCNPSSTGGFTAADWTAVINEILREIYYTGQVLDQFSQLNSIRSDTFLAQGAELPAIAGQLNLAGAADNHTEVDPREIFAGILGIAGAIAAETGPAGLPLEIASEILSMLPSASPTLTSKFPATYADLQAKFAQAVTEADKALEVQSQEVRQSWGLMTLVGELRQRGTWPTTLDAAGMKSAADEGFALWAYKQLLPTIYDRYSVTACNPATRRSNDSCGRGGPHEGVIGDPPSFTTLAAPFARSVFGFPNVPCFVAPGGVNGPGFYRCDYEAPPAQISSTVWGAVSPSCSYKPGDAQTVWTFGCNLGVDPQASVSMTGGPADGWDFTSYSGDPVPQVHAASRATVGAGGRVDIVARVRLPHGFDADSATVAHGDLLAPLRRGASPIAAGRPLRLTSHGRNGVLRTAPRATGGGARPRASLTIRRSRHRGVSLRLSVDAIDVGVPELCRSLPRSLATGSTHVALSTTLALRDGPRSRTIAMPTLWRCVRGRTGGVAALRPVRPRKRRLRPGLGVSLSAPRSAPRDAAVSFRVRVRNRRHGHRGRVLSSLWHVSARAVVTTRRRDGRRAHRTDVARVLRRRVAQLRRRRSRTFRLRVRVPRRSGARVCVRAIALADSSRAAHASRCVRAATHHRRPRFTG